LLQKKSFFFFKKRRKKKRGIEQGEEGGEEEVDEEEEKEREGLRAETMSLKPEFGIKTSLGLRIQNSRRHGNL